MLYNVISYIQENLGIKVDILPLDVGLAKLPYYLMVNYVFYEGKINTNRVIFAVSSKRENYTSLQYEKQLSVIRRIFQVPVILVLESIESYNRKRLIERRINFIEPDKQIYIPELLIDLKEFKSKTEKHIEKFSPATQCILLYHLQKRDINNMAMNLLAETTGYTSMTISRAVNELSRADLVSLKRSSMLMVEFKADKKTTWDNALKYLENPVKQKFYTDELPLLNYCYKTGLTAMAHYTFLADKDETAYAVYKNIYSKFTLGRKNETEGKYLMELWSYDPGKLAKNGYVDPLSLYMIFKDDTNERIQGELEKLINNILW